MTTFHFQTHVSDNGVITLPPDVMDFYGKSVLVNVDVDDIHQRTISFEELCDAWCADERSAEDVIRDIYESRTIGREREPLSERKTKRSFEELCGAWGKEEDREDIARMVAAIHEGRLLGTERETL